MATKRKKPDLYRQPSLLNLKLGLDEAAVEETQAAAEPEIEEEIPTVGDRLRQAREEQGLSLHQVAGILRLRASQIQALEDGDYNRLPGQTFVTGFLRSYANLLNLDAVWMVDLYKQEHSGGMHIPSLAFPEPSSEGRMPGKGILIATLILALILVAGWFVYQESGGENFERVADLPDYLAKKIENLPVDTADTASQAKVPVAIETPEIVSTPAADNETTTEVVPVQAEASKDSEPQMSETADQETSEQETSEVADVTPAPTLVDDVPVAADEKAEVIPAPEKDSAETAAADEAESTSEKTESTPAVAEVAETRPTETKVADTQATDTAPVSKYPQATLDKSKVVEDDEPESPLPRTFGVENTNARVVIRAREEAWVEVKTPNEEPYISRVLKPGDIYMAPNVENVTLTTGNAGALEVRVDGREIAALGGNGAIVRDIPLVAESLLDNGSLN